MKLHEAIEYVINREGQPLSSRQIAIAINNLSLYKREDGRALEPSQIAARVNNTPLVFDRTEDDLIYVKKGTQVQYEKLVYELQDLFRNYELRNVDVTIATYIFLQRVRSTHPQYLKRFKNNSLITKLGGAPKPILGYYKTSFDITKEDENLIIDLIQSLTPELEYKLFEVMNRYDFSLTASSHRQFGAFFNELLNSSTVTKSALGDFSTPRSISKIISDIAEFANGESVFDPFAGNAGIFCDILHKKNRDFSLRLNDIDSHCVWMGKMNLVLNNFKNFTYQYENSIDDFINHQQILPKYDWIITHPPFGGRLSKDVLRNVEHPRFGYSTRSELVFLEMILSQLKDRGKAIIIIPESFLFSEEKAVMEARKYLVNNALLTAVISLPTGAFLPYTSAKASILYINSDIASGLNEGVQFVDLSEDNLKSILANEDFSVKELCEKKTTQSNFVSRNEIENEKYSLVVNRYVLKETETYSSDFRKLYELISQQFTGKGFKGDLFNKKGGIPFINIKDLADENKSYNLNLEKVDSFLDFSYYQKAKPFKEVPVDAILLAKVGNKLKPTINKTGKPFAVSGNIFVIVPDKTIISPLYLLSQLSEGYVLKQIDRIRGGAAQPFVSTDDLLNIHIRVPSFKEQKEIELSFAFNRIDKVPNSEWNDITIKREEIDLASAITHEYKNLKNPLSTNISNIREFLNNKIYAKDLISWEDKIAVSASARSIQVVFDDVDGLLNEMSSLIDDIITVVNLDKQLASSNKKDILALPFLEKTEQKLKNEFPELQFDLKYSDRKSFSGVRIEINENLFFKVIRNFSQNSLKHGYHNTNVRPVYIIPSITDDELMLQIDLVNDGKPFDAGFTFSDFISFGKKTGKSKGSGIGGFIMNQIVLLHKGTMEMVEPGETDLFGNKLKSLLKTGVHFRIKLPILK